MIDNPPIYNVDPEKVMSGKASLRTSISFADTCANLFKLELTDIGLPGFPPKNTKIRAGYVIQQIKDTAGQPNEVENIWPGDSVEPAIPPASLNFTTSALGFNELAGEVGCFNYMPKLSASVKTAGVAIDLAELAKRDVDLQTLEVKMLEQKVEDLKWRKVNWIVLETSFAARVAIMLAASSFNPASVLNGVVHGIPLAAMVTSAAFILKQTKNDLENAEKSLAEKNKLLDEAKRLSDLKSELASQNVRDVNALQSVKDPL